MIVLLAATLFMSAEATFKIPYYLSTGQTVVFTFNGDPAVTRQWNGKYWFHGLSSQYLDGGPWLLSNSQNEHFMFHPVFGNFVKFIDIQSYLRRGSYSIVDTLWFERRFNYTLQLTGWRTPDEYEPSQGLLLPSREQQHPKRSGPINKDLYIITQQCIQQCASLASLAYDMGQRVSTELAKQQKPVDVTIEYKYADDQFVFEEQ